MVVAFVPHTTAGITINENADPDVKSDMLQKLSTLVPKHEPYYEHGEGNSDSHVKTALVGNSVTVLVEDGRLVLGTWQGVYFCEFDGPRQRELLIKVVDGRAFNGHFWVFYGALSDVAYTVTVTDTTTGAVRTYVNRSGVRPGSGRPVPSRRLMARMVMSWSQSI